MKVCSLYGAGYYYIPGTDTCIKIGGYVRWETYHNRNPGGETQFLGNGTQSAYNRHTDTYTQRARGVISADVRSQTEYGTLRSYMLFGINTTTGGQGGGGAILTAVAAHARAFIQFAGFTAGLTDSFYDFYNGAAYGFVATYVGSAVGPAGILVGAYTAQFGNGVSASISLEDAQARTKPVVDLSAGAAGALTSANILPAFAGAVNDVAGTRHADIVGNIRVDQAWGSAQVMGALHEVRARYYNNNGTTGCNLAAQLNTTGCGAPGDEWGWAIGAGMTLKMPWNPKDTLSFQVNFTEGAIGYAAVNGVTLTLNKADGVALLPVASAVFSSVGAAPALTQLELTEAWSIEGAFEHWWTPSLRTSIHAHYVEYDYNQNATNSICAAIAAGGGIINAGTFSGRCDPDGSVLTIASRTMWNPVANLDIGLEVAYTKVDSGIEGTAFMSLGNGTPATSRYALVDQEVWHAIFRVQRNFWP